MIYLILIIFCVANAEEHIPLPEKFFLGAASSAFQIEGGWNEDGKGESIWDTFAHKHPYWIEDGSNGDIAADSYHQFEHDIQALKFMRLNSYRFSISWPRILPKGDLSLINEDGIRYYDHLIDRLIEEDIEPIVTMFHWDIPQRLQTEFGGWTNPIMPNYFEDYAWLLFSKFGDRVKWWITINEPHIFCLGYGPPVKFAPQTNSSGRGDYLCGHNLLLAHGKAYRLYEHEFRLKQKGKVSLTLNINWAEPKTQNPEDIQAVKNQLAFQFDFYANPIFSPEGDYPKLVHERVLKNSISQGLRHSRLPLFTQTEIEMLQGSADFLGLNYYMTFVVNCGNEGEEYSKDWDKGVQLSSDPSWPKTRAPWMTYYPKGLYKALLYINEKYPGNDIFITENGYPDDGEINDPGRVQSLLDHLRESLKAWQDHGVSLIGYMHWSLVDSMEWANGYTIKFGLCQVNFTDPNRPRKFKTSAWVYQDIAKQWTVPAFSQIQFGEGYCDKENC